MNRLFSIAAIAMGVSASSCVETVAAQVRVRGVLEAASTDQSRCTLSLSPTPEYLSTNGRQRQIRGAFVEEFIIEPRWGTYVASVKCGDAVKISKVIEYREFGAEPYDLGSIA